MGVVLGPCFAMQYMLSFLVLWSRELVALLLLSSWCYVAVLFFGPRAKLALHIRKKAFSYTFGPKIWAYSITILMDS